MPGIDILQLLNGSEGLSDIAPIVATELECGDATLLKVVELLSTWLTNPDKEQRRQGTSLLSDILKIIPCSLLNEKECLFMVSFFCDRLMDHYSIIPFALEGLAALSGMDNFSDESPKEIIGALQENVTCQALTQEQRNVFYTIMYNLLVKKSELISTNFPSEYMYALVSGMDSESDPRNLLFLFSFLPKAFSEVPLKHLAEEAFAVLECYFPVDFTPVQEKGNVTREDLALGLEACFIASSAFAEFCIPMVCDKLESTLKIAQLDSLRLVINGFKNWNIESTDALIKRLWFSIKDVLIPGNDAEVASLAGEALVSILSAYSKAALSETEAKSLNFLLENVLSSTFSYLSDPSLSLFLPTSKLLSDVIAVSSTTAGFILPRILSQLLALLEMDSKQKDLILKALAPILVSSVKFNAWENGLCEDILKKLLPIILTSIEDERCGGSGFSCLTSIINKLSDDVRLSLYVSLQKILSSKSFPSYRKEFAIFIRTLCEEHPIEVEKHLISCFHIPEELDLQARNYLELLTWTMDYPNLIEAAAAVISNHITMSELAVWRKDAVFVLRDYIIKADVKILVLLGTECDFPHKLLVSYFNATDMNEDEVECVADIVTRIVRVLDAGLQISILRNGLELFHSNIPVNEYSPNKLVLLEGLACGLCREVDIPNSLQLCEFLIECSISSNSIVTTTSAARLLAVFINKMNNDNDLDRVLKVAKSKIQGNLSISSVRLSAWITKSLILRSYSPVCDDWLGELLHLVSSEEYGIAAAEGLNLLLEESRFLSEANHCNIGLLYRQRVFQKIELIIPENGKPSKSESLALAYILKYSPTSLVLGIIGQLTGVMVHCLKSDDSSVVLAILAILSHLLESSVDILRTLAETFIPQCIFLAQTSPYMLVRQDALKCLYLYGKYNSVDMLPYKNTVLTGLQKCLDDKKRLVRQSAVKTRTRWFLI